MLIIDQDTCTQCNTCAEECNNGCLSIRDEVLEFDETKCNMCGHCMAVCPCDAIVIDGDGYDCEDVVDLSFTARPGVVEMGNLIMHRRSVRRFTDTEISEDQIAAILEAGKYAPTAKNAQGNVFMVVKDPEKRQEMVSDMADVLLAKGKALADKAPGAAAFFINKASKYIEQGKDEILYDAPLVVFVFADSAEDGAICASTMGFMINSMRLGYCFAQLPTDAFADEAFAEKWQAPEGKKCAMALLIGEAEAEYFCSVTRKTPPVIRY